MNRDWKNSLVTGLTSVVQGFAAFVLTGSLSFSLLFDAFGGGIGVGEVLVAVVLLGLLVFGILRKFGMWIPAAVGGAVGVVVGIILALFFLFMLTIVFGVAANGGQ